MAMHPQRHYEFDTVASSLPRLVREMLDHPLPRHPAQHHARGRGFRTSSGRPKLGTAAPAASKS